RASVYASSRCGRTTRSNRSTSRCPIGNPQTTQGEKALGIETPALGCLFPAHFARASRRANSSGPLLDLEAKVLRHAGGVLPRQSQCRSTDLLELRLQIDHIEVVSALFRRESPV